ncbi:pirin family protein [Paenibacillus sp. CAU 1782]
MIKVLPAAERHESDLGWLQSRPVYSFGGYQDPSRGGFGVLRVCNDDRLAPGKGFGAHPHSDMEIVSIVLEGEIRHEDSLGNAVTTTFGEVQVMSAGSGVIHTEFNASSDTELRLLQLWFMPAERGKAPGYKAGAFSVEGLRNRLLPVVSSEAGPGVVPIDQDMTIFLSRLDAGKDLVHKTSSGRKLFLYVIEGSLNAEDVTLVADDTAEIQLEAALRLSADGETFFMLIDMP